jgi:hypothetical protein
MSRHVLKVNRAGIGRNQSRRSIVLGANEWDGGSGFRCTTTLPAPKEIQFLPSPPQRKTAFPAYLKYLFVYDEYIDNMEMYEMFTLERGLDIPERKTGPKYPYDQLELGDSFYLEGGDLSKLCNANYREWRRTGKKFTARKVENGVRVWRIE